MESKPEGTAVPAAPRSRRVRRWIVAALSAALVLGSLALILRLSSNSPDTVTSGALLPPSPTALPSFDPAKFHRLLVQLKGKPVVVNFWGSWCGPCIGEAPLLAAAATQYRGRVQFIGVDVQDDVPNARAFIRRFGWSYPSVFDPPGSIEGSLGMSGQPVTIFFDAAGKQVSIRSGAVQDGEVQRELDKILGT